MDDFYLLNLRHEVNEAEKRSPGSGRDTARGLINQANVAVEETFLAITPFVAGVEQLGEAVFADEEAERQRKLLAGGGRLALDVATLGIGRAIGAMSGFFRNAFRGMSEVTTEVAAETTADAVVNETRSTMEGISEVEVNASLKASQAVETAAEAAANDARYELEGMSSAELKVALEESEAVVNEARAIETATDAAANETRALEESGAAVNEARAAETATDAVANETRVLPKVRGRPRRMVKTDIALGLGGVTAIAAGSQIPNAEAPIADLPDTPDTPDATDHREPIVTSGGPLERRNPTIQLDLVTPTQSVALGTETTEYPIIPIAILLVAMAAAIYKWDT
jgi:hypothetical protein